MLPREIQTETRPDRTRYDLPVRPLGALRLMGLLPMAFAVLFAWMPAHQILRSLGRISGSNGSGFEWFFVVFLSVFVLAALMPFAFGLFILAGRTRLVVTRDRIITTELAGPFRWSRIARFNQIERLEFGTGAGQDQRDVPGLFRNLSGIVAILKDGKKSPLAIGYPHDWLAPLLEELVSTLQLQGTVVPVTKPTLQSNLEAVTTEARVEKPAGSTIELNDSGWGVELQVPSRGLWKESYGMLGFGIFWCLIVGAISSGLLFGHHRGGSWLGALAFLSLFWAIGITFLVAGIHLGTRRWTLRADRTQLRVALKSALRARAWQWAAGDVEDVRVGDSGTRVNDRVIEQLQVLSRTGRKKTGLLSGRTHEELAWVATTLRQALGTQAAVQEEEAPPRIDASRRQG